MGNVVRWWCAESYSEKNHFACLIADSLTRLFRAGHAMINPYFSGCNTPNLAKKCFFCYKIYKISFFFIFFIQLSKKSNTFAKANTRLLC
jgi:hypothetical protein